MTSPLPDLDLTYDALMKEALALIPAYDPGWTNRNPSDPGITLLELFAWLMEALVYQLDQITDGHKVTFLRLLNGPEWRRSSSLSLDEDIRRTLLALRAPHRAVTCDDFETLAAAVSPMIRRTKCIPNCNIDAEHPVSDKTAGWVSVLLVTVPEIDAQALTTAVLADLKPRLLLGALLAVGAPVYVPLEINIVVIAATGAHAAGLTKRVEDAVETWLDPLTGGADGGGWPFGAPVHPAELLGVASKVAGVALTVDADVLVSSGGAGYGRQGKMGSAVQFEVVRLEAYQLPKIHQLRVFALHAPDPMIIGVTFKVIITKSGSTEATKETARQAVIAAARTKWREVAYGAGYRQRMQWEIDFGHFSKIKENSELKVLNIKDINLGEKTVNGTISIQDKITVPEDTAVDIGFSVVFEEA